MRRVVLVLLFVISISSAAFASDADFDAMLKNRREALKNMQQQVIDGNFPVFISVSCEDNAVANKLKSLMTSALRKKDNVRIVANRDNAWFWIYVLAIKERQGQVAVSVVYGQDEKAFTFRNDFDFSDVFSYGTQDVLNSGSFSIYVYSHDKLGKLTSEIADEFDVRVLEVARLICGPHIERFKKSNKEAE